MEAGAAHTLIQILALPTNMILVNLLNLFEFGFIICYL